MGGWDIPLVAKVQLRGAIGIPEQASMTSHRSGAKFIVVENLW